MMSDRFCLKTQDSDGPDSRRRGKDESKRAPIEQPENFCQTDIKSLFHRRVIKQNTSKSLNLMKKLPSAGSGGKIKQAAPALPLKTEKFKPNRYKSLFLFFALHLTLPSCWTIRFVQEENQEVIIRSQWRHIGLFGLSEFSPPFLINENCLNGFAYVETKTDTSQVFLKAFSQFWLFSYLPESVSVGCMPENSSKKQRSLASVNPKAEGRRAFRVLKVKGEKAIIRFTQPAGALKANQTMQVQGISESAVIKISKGRKAVIYTKGTRLKPDTFHTGFIK